MFFRALTGTTAAAVLTGCYSIAVSAATIGMPTSKYMPVLGRDSATDDRTRLRDSYDGKVVSDTASKHFSARHGALCEGFFQATGDEPVLRNLTAGATGLLEPQWSYREDGPIHLNPVATRKRHEFLTKSLQLQLLLLPLAATEAYAAHLMTSATGERHAL